jgi:hypothetical protein
MRNSEKRCEIKDLISRRFVGENAGFCCLQSMRHRAIHTWNLFMASMRSLFAQSLSALILSNHLLLKKTYIKELIWRESVNFNPDS